MAIIKWTLEKHVIMTREMFQTRYYGPNIIIHEATDVFTMPHFFS